MPHDGQTQGPRGWPNILGLLRGTNLKVLGKAGATAGAGLAGGTTSGAPTSGQFDVGEAIVSQSDGSLWICTVAGSPGTFVQAGFANPLTTKADVLVGGTAGAASRLGVGSDNQVLTADSTQTLGLKWAVTAAGAGGALTQVAQHVSTGTDANVIFSSIPGTYRDLEVVWQARCDGSGAVQTLALTANSDTSSNYLWIFGRALSDSATLGEGDSTGLLTNLHVGDLAATSAMAHAASSGRLIVHNYAGTTFYKDVTAEWGFAVGTASAGANYQAYLGHGLWLSQTAITSLAFFPANGNFIAGTVITLYGRS